MENKILFIHDIKLPEKDSFTKNFNMVSEMFQKAREMELIDAHDKDKYWDAYFSAKYCLEQGIY